MQLPPFKVVRRGFSTVAFESSAINSIVNINYLFILQRKGRQSLQPHIFVATLREDCYQLAQEALTKAKCKSTTFNHLRNVTDEEKLNILQQFKESGYKKEYVRHRSAVNKQKKTVGSFSFGFQFYSIK